MHLKALALTGLTLIAAGALVTGSAQASVPAMGTGNPYQDLQTGVSYTVYQPSNTLGGKLTGSPYPNWCSAGSNAEQNLSANYSKGNRPRFSISEANPLCFDFAVGVKVGTSSILGHTAVITAYCPPPGNGCSRNDVFTYGGNLRVKLPAAKGLRETDVVIETLQKGVTASQLEIIAKSLRPVQ
ncbi:MAG: hypothetical protein ORN20_02995 [Candidatus Nanopelagicales bacterium]|nr:hypothetical protein [Candidatus Nanopelagicales bacterium]